MLIPAEPETAEDYLTRASEALLDERTHIYVDTSFVMWLTTIGPDSRAGFLDWSSTVAARLHVPLWTSQEYHHHHRERTLKGRVERSCEKVLAAAVGFGSALSVHADGPLLRDEPEDAFSRELSGVRARLASLTAAARSWDYDAAAAQVIGWMNGQALDRSEAFASFARLEAEGGARYGHRVPPGYEDRRKRRNRYGDLLFWQDVMEDGKLRGAERVVVLTRDRKEDWYASEETPEVGTALKRLRSRWHPVPTPHPMLAFEVRAHAGCELLLIDDLYLGAILWRRDRKRFGRLSAVAFGMGATRLAAELAPPPSVMVRTAARAAEDTITAGVALQLVRAAVEGEPVGQSAALLAAFGGDAPAAEAALEGMTPGRLESQSGVEIAPLARALHDLANVDQPFAKAAAERLLDSVDKVDAERASAIVCGFLASSFYEGSEARNLPTGPLLQDAYVWARDSGCARLLKALASRLARDRSPALVMPDAVTSSLDVQLLEAEGVATVPAPLGQIFIGAQGILTNEAVDQSSLLSTLLGGRSEATVGEIVEAVGRHYGVPLVSLKVIEARDEEPRTIPDGTGLARFGPLRQPLRGNAPVLEETEPDIPPAEAGDALGEIDPEDLDDDEDEEEDQ